MFELRQRLLRRLAVLPRPPLAVRPQRLLDAPQAVAQIGESLRHVEFGKGGIGRVAAANVLRVALHVARQFLLLLLGESLAHLGGCLRLGGPHVAYGVLHGLFELLEILRFGFLPVGERRGLRRSEVFSPFLGGDGAPQILLELLLGLHKSVGLIDQAVHLVAGLGGAQTLESLLGILEAGCRAAGFRFVSGLAGLRRAHVLNGLLQPADGLFQLLLADRSRLPLHALLRLRSLLTTLAHLR